MIGFEYLNRYGRLKDYICALSKTHFSPGYDACFTVALNASINSLY